MIAVALLDFRDEYFRIILVRKYEERDLLGDLRIDRGDHLNWKYLH
jgi:hypothetical protein